MLITTTPNIEGKRITRYYGIVSGETIVGANIFRDFFASIRDVIGGRSNSYEEVLRKAKDSALRERIRLSVKWKNKRCEWEPMPLLVWTWIMKR